MNETSTSNQRPEIIAVASGKGGTGKTLIAMCLGNALVRAGHRVLLIDSDTGTYGLSLYLLGPGGEEQIEKFESHETFAGALQDAQGSFETRTIYRSAKDDHQVDYDALICGREIYGDVPSSEGLVARDQYWESVRSLFEKIRDSAQFDYVIVDTRGGFGFRSTDVCALADSYLMVTEADRTSFYQDRNLAARIDEAAESMGEQAVLRGVLVNKVVGDVDSFRNTLEAALPVTFKQTYPIPVDVKAIEAHQRQQIPYVSCPASKFAYATLKAFADIFEVVISRWCEDRVGRWNEFVETIKQAITEHNTDVVERERAERRRRWTPPVVAAVIAAVVGVLFGYALWGSSLSYWKTQGETLAEDNRTLQSENRRSANEAAQLRASEAEMSSEKSALASELKQEEAENDRLVNEVAALTTQNTTLTSENTGLQKKLSAFTERREMLETLYATDTAPGIRLEIFRELREKGERVFDKVDLSLADLTTVDLTGVSLRGAKLSGVRLGGVFKDVDLTGADLSQAQMQFTILSDSKLDKADLSGANLIATKFEKTSVRDTIFQGARINSEDWMSTNAPSLLDLDPGRWEAKSIGEEWILISTEKGGKPQESEKADN